MWNGWEEANLKRRIGCGASRELTALENGRQEEEVAKHLQHGIMGKCGEIKSKMICRTRRDATHTQRLVAAGWCAGTRRE